MSGKVLIAGLQETAANEALLDVLGGRDKGEGMRAKQHLIQN
jgi:hypothetical protein